MTSENGYPQQGGYEKFLEKPNEGIPPPFELFFDSFLFSSYSNT